MKNALMKTVPRNSPTYQFAEVIQNGNLMVPKYSIYFYCYEIAVYGNMV